MLRKLRKLFWVSLLLGAAGASSSQDMRYGYDELGRLIEAVDAASRVTRYAYDPAGNLLRVTVEGELIEPSIEGEIIDQFRCGAPVEYRISGTGLESVQVTTSDPHLAISNVQHQDGILGFTLLADCAAPPGQYQLILSTPSGTLVLDISIDPSLPGVLVTPVPLAVPPDGSERAFIVRLTNSDTVDHAFSLSVTDPEIAQVTLSALLIEAGSMEVTGGLRGLVPGHTVLHLESGTLGAWKLPVFVTADFAGVNTSVGRPVGVQLEVLPAETPPFATAVEGAHVGLVKGRFLSHLMPSAVILGSEGVSLEIHGAGFDANGSVSIEPDEGLLTGEPAFDPSGERISLSLSVSPDAPTTVRRVVVRDAVGAPIAASEPEADRLRVVARAPELHSVSPMNVVPGDTGLTLTLRGANLSEIVAIHVDPPEGITLGGTPEINADGTVVQTGLTVSPNAVYGPRVITVVTPGGSSGNAPSPHNTVNVVPLIDEQIPVLPATVVGVLREVSQGPGERAVHADAPSVGLVKGPVLERLEPAAVPVGGTQILTLVGAGLDAVDAITISPDDGIQVQGVPLPGADAASVSIQISVADEAATSLRQVKAFIEGQPVHPSAPDADRLRITPGAPVLHSASPQNLLADGEVRIVELRGLRLDHASRLEIIPADHISVGSLSVSDDGTVVRTRVDVSPGAEPGPRLLRIHAPGGVTSDEPSPANTVYVVEEIEASVPALIGTSVGVVRDVEALPVSPPEYPLHAPAVGLMREAVPQSVETAHTRGAPSVGVTRGALATAVSVHAMRPGESVSMEISGFELAGVTQVAFEPDADIAVESIEEHPDGRTVSVSVAVAPVAEPGPRRIRLLHADGEVLFSDPMRAVLRIARDAPRTLSIEPILAGQGDVFTLLIRGERLHDAEAVFVEPSGGLRFGNVVTISADGTELTVPVSVDPDAPLGARVIRVRVPGWETGSVPEPANTFTVYESVP